jgi:hypothetical protein
MRRLAEILLVVCLAVMPGGAIATVTWTILSGDPQNFDAYSAIACGGAIYPSFRTSRT